MQSAAPARTRCQCQPVPRSAMPCAFKQKGERVHVHMTGRALPAALRGRLLLERHLQDTQGAAAEPQAARGLLRWPRRLRRALPPEGPDAPRDCRAAVGRRLHRTRRHRAARASASMAASHSRPRRMDRASSRRRRARSARAWACSTTAAPPAEDKRRRARNPMVRACSADAAPATAASEEASLGTRSHVFQLHIAKI